VSRLDKMEVSRTPMHEVSFSTQPTMIREMGHQGRNVRISIWYGANIGPVDSGFGVLRDLGPDPRVQGFPVIKASVESSGHGYENLYGWLQGVAHLQPDGSAENWSPDSIPSLRDRGMPFCVLGYHPTFYDAPFFPELPSLHWQADLFLTPLVVRRPSEEEVLPLAGFRWGFKIPAAGRTPEILPLETVGKAAWAESLPLWRFWYPSWRFADWPEA
jgi:hypothetical protein